MKYLLAIFLIISLPIFVNSYAQKLDPIPITISDKMNKIKFDGKWSFESEWKASTLSEFFYNDTEIVMRSAHQGDFIYIFIDPVEERSLNYLQDKATICFAPDYNNTQKPNIDDYCFVATLGKPDGITLRGSDTGFKQIPNQKGFIAIGNSSDNNDRYTDIQHPSYEYKIPIDLLGRADKYGFFLSVYDANTTKYHNWPTNTTNLAMLQPNYWGLIISPDKSLPEFGLPIVILLPLLVLVIILTKKLDLKTQSS